MENFQSSSLYRILPNFARKQVENYPHIAQLLVKLFDKKFSPKSKFNEKAYDKISSKIMIFITLILHLLIFTFLVEATGLDIFLKTHLSDQIDSKVFVAYSTFHPLSVLLTSLESMDSLIPLRKLL